MSELVLQAARNVRPRRLAVGLAAIWGTFTILGLAVAHGVASWNLQAFNLHDSDLDRRLSMPASFTALLLLAAAGMAFALVGVDRSRRRRTWRLTGWALFALGLEELLGIHSWLESRGSPWSVDYLPFLLVTAYLLFGAVRVFRRQPTVRIAFAGGLGLLLLGGLLDNPSLSASGTAAEILEMAAASLFVLCLLARHRYLARQYYPLDEAESRLSLDQIASEALERVPFRPIAVGLVLMIAAFGIQDVLLHTGNYHGHRVPILDVNTEQTLWATIQGSLIFLAGGLALVIARLRVTPQEMRRWWNTIGGVLFVLGADEIIAIHDRFQEATGVTGQVILIPVALVGIVAWWKVLQAVSGNSMVRKLWIAGAVVWFVSQATDVLFQQDHRWLIVPEEMEETTGTSLWLFALLYWLRAALPSRLFPPPAMPAVDQIAAPRRGTILAAVPAPEPEPEQTPAG